MTSRSHGRNDALDADDAALWAHIAAQVRPLRPPAPSKPKGAAPKAAKPAVGLRASVETATVSPPAPPPRPLAPGGREKLPRGDERKLRRGTVAIGGRLDLHGMTRPEAHRAVGRFLAALAERGERIALVITGKGRRETAGEVGEGVLRSEFPHWIAEGALSRIVLAWRPAAPQHGGAGAFYVLLRRLGR